MDVREVDPDDDAAFDRWYAVVDAVHRGARPGEPWWQRQEVQAAARGGASQRCVTLAAVVAGETVGTARLDLPQHDHPQRASLMFLSVLPAHRRRGAATALLAQARRLARQDGRTELVGGLDEHPGEPSPGRRFVQAAGAACVRTDVRRDLALPVDPARLDALEAQARPGAAGYRLVGWEGTCPDHLVEDRALLAQRMSTDAPSGDLEVQEEAWDVARVREHEDVLRAQGRLRLAAGAVVRETGRMVAFTEVSVPLAVPERAYQGDTLVLREHRGRRLGLLLEVHALRRVADQWPRTRLVSTWNAHDNGPMIAVDEALGCVVAGTSTTWRLAP